MVEPNAFAFTESAKPRNEFMKDRTAFFPSETGLLTTNARRCSGWSSDSEWVFILILGILVSATVFCRAQIQVYGYIPDASVTGFNPFTANQGRVFVIDTATNQLVGAPIPVGFLPAGVAVTPDGRYAYVSNNFSGPRGNDRYKRFRCEHLG